MEKAPGARNHRIETHMEDPVNSTQADNLIRERADSVPMDSDEYRDLDTALYQSARLRGGRDYTFDTRMGPLALPDSVDRLRGWQANSDATDEEKEAMGVLSDHIRERAAFFHSGELLSEVERLREELAQARIRLAAYEQSYRDRSHAPFSVGHYGDDD